MKHRPPGQADGVGSPGLYDVVVLAASAGGNGAIATVLAALPRDFAVPIVVMQHFPADAREPLRAFRPSLPFDVIWAGTGTMVARGAVLVSPPRSYLEILPDGTAAIWPCPRGPLGKPIDRLFRSLAGSFAHRAIAVVLSGMMDDGADGARELRGAGGIVIAQAEADFGEMPRAAVRSGGADVSLPVEQIGALLVDLAAGASIPRPRSELDAVVAIFGGEGQARAAMRAVNWAATPLGPVRGWSPALAVAAKNQMNSSFATCIFWGPEFVQIYNDAYLPLLGSRAAPAGKPARLTWPELWSSMGRRLEDVRQTGLPAHAEDQLFQVERDGHLEESYFTHSHSPLYDGDGAVGGVLVTLTETTAHVRAARRLNALCALATIETGGSALAVAENAAKVLAEVPLDVPFALIYLLNAGRARATLAAAVGMDAGSVGAPRTVLLDDDQASWPLRQVVRDAAAMTLEDLTARLPELRLGPWPESPSSALLVPLRSGPGGPVSGVAILGSSPRLRFDPAYREFQRVAGQHIGNAIGEAEARGRERDRSDRLAELDRAKIDFFSNVSHEFRTPLTLLLGPLEEMLVRRPSLPADLKRAVDGAARNGRQMLALVNNLLDFSQAESSREPAHFELTDLAGLTADIAAAFRAPIEAGGLRLEVRCASDMPLIAIDRQMWEKIVSNLLSNAVKFTFQGKIVVTLRSLALHTELTVADTGVGIPGHELPNLFKRFHRVRGARARTAEGAGIGLWMVDDLVKRMGGQLRVRSKEEAGTTFTAWVPLKSLRRGDADAERSSSFRPGEFANRVARQAGHWVSPDDRAGRSDPPGDVIEDVFGPPQTMLRSERGREPARILVVDDNADMRSYLQRLLSPRWRVDTAPNGERAFEMALDGGYQLILTDVMMPGIDGFELLRRVRAHSELQHTSVVLLTARAGEEAASEGLMAGADDYIAKPFSPRELVTRIAAVERVRDEAALRRSKDELLARNEDLERFNRLNLGRELHVLELKKQINELRERLGEGPRYPTAFGSGEGEPERQIPPEESR